MIDIIIPVYNTPIDDLERCLESIINQTFKNYKVYIINDGSNNLTKNFLNKYVINKNNFIVKHIKNNGVSNARNVGIELSNSKYIAFVDADDTVEKNFLEDAYNIIEENNLDIIIGGYNDIKNDKIVKLRKSEKGLHIYENNDIEKFLEKLLSSKTNDTNKEIGDCPTGRIYTRLFKRDSIVNVRFNLNINISEDTLFMIDYTYQVKRIGIIDKIWYNHYKNDYSLTHATKRELMINNINNFIIEIKKRMNKESKENIKKAYQLRIDKANNYINKIKNTNI